MNKQSPSVIRNLGYVFVLVQAPLQAAEWTSSAGVDTSIEYTDNVCLSSDNEQGEWIGKVTPDIAFDGSGRRANASLLASVEVNSLSDDDLEDLGCTPRDFGNRNQFAPRLSADADAELIQSWFYIDADADIDQNSVSPFGSGGDDTLDRTGNTNTTYRYSVSPYIQRRFKDTADLTLRYTYDEQFNSKDIVGDSAEQSVQLLFAGGARFNPWSWSLQGDYSKVDYAERSDLAVENNDSELSSAQFNVGYQLNRVLQVNGHYGQEWNDFVSSREGDIDGDFWDLGFRWTPNARTTLEAGKGNRFFGDTYRFSLDHRHKRSVLSASYSEDLTYDRDIRTQDDPISGLPPGSGGNSTTLSNSPILDERFTLGYTYEGRRSTLGISASHSDQTRADSDTITGLSETRFTDVSASFSRSLSRQLSISARASWSEDEPKDSSSAFLRTAETWRVNLGAQQQLNQNLSLSFDYQYEDRQSDSDATTGTFFDDYTENRFTLTLRIQL